MHTNHLIGCAFGIALALGIVALSGGSAGSLGVLAVLLLCPIVMGGVMWLLVRPDPHRAAHHTSTIEGEEATR